MDYWVKAVKEDPNALFKAVNQAQKASEEIFRSINKLEHSEGWCARLLSIRQTTKNQNGRVVHVYEESIFDLLLDLYEDEYLLRFSQPRRGDNNSTPDILELRRFFGLSLWVSAVPAIIAIISVLLIHSRNFSPDSLSDLAAGALLFSMLWTSSCLSVDKIKPEVIKQEFRPEVTLSSVFYNNNIAFMINSNVKDAKEFLYRTSPDVNFHTAALITNQTNNTLQHGIINVPQKGITILRSNFLTQTIMKAIFGTSLLIWERYFLVYASNSFSILTSLGLL